MNPDSQLHKKEMFCCDYLGNIGRLYKRARLHEGNGGILMCEESFRKCSAINSVCNVKTVSTFYCLQWMIVDYKLFKPGSPLVPNTLWILEQIPGTVMMADMTMKLIDETYWSSYNLP